jgi:TetR/AcrR family transcriptional regulator, mexJK operon transcriptional repressor
VAGEPATRVTAGQRSSGRARPLARSGRPGSGRGRPAGGSEPKRVAIGQAALDLFLRDGFARASVDAIAAEAGVSKRTIYNHYGDKERLFLSVISETYDSMIGAVEHLMGQYLTDLPDNAVEQGIISFAVEAALFAARTPQRSAMIRLMMAEAPHFPELLRVQLRPRGITAAIADRLTKLNARGLLDVPEPVEAANHLFALTMGQMNNRSLYGAIALDDAEITRMATSGAQAFLRAYRPQ